MNRLHLHESYPDQAVEHTKWHLTMLGKDPTRKTAIEILDAIVRNNPNFRQDLDITDTVHAFFSAVHYGSHELKNATLSAHARSMSNFLEARSSTHAHHDYQSPCPPKPESWQYDPQEPLPSDISPERAMRLLYALAEWRKGNTINEWRMSDGTPLKMGAIVNWQHYVNKLKARAKA
jgi:hypothetical protein